MAEYQVLFEPDSENSDIVILSSLLDPAAYLNSIVGNFVTLHITIYMYIEFLERKPFSLMEEWFGNRRN